MSQLFSVVVQFTIAAKVAVPLCKDNTMNVNGIVGRIFTFFKEFPNRSPGPSESWHPAHSLPERPA